MYNLNLINSVENWTNLPRVKEGFKVLVGADNNTLLMLAIDSCKADMHVENRLKTLIKKGGNINAQNSNGDTALMMAAKKGLPQVIKVLIKEKADPAIENNDGFTALYLLKPDANHNALGHTNYLEARNILLKKTNTSFEEYQEKLALLSTTQLTQEQHSLSENNTDTISTHIEDNVNNNDDTNHENLDDFNFDPDDISDIMGDYEHYSGALD
ncbi:MAG: ankyrin repeat domain-containing protein [Rickettsiaceae bacterium]|nr:ankyrin repeat domain-containing protein [Rickettsiaceae bacterium]